MKKIISAFLAMLIFALPISAGLTAISQKSQAAEINFKCGDNATWNLDENGVLTISGTGELYELASPLWDRFDKDIKSVVIGEGIRNIPDWAFKGCLNAEKLHISSTVETIGSFSFDSYYHNFETITIAENSLLRDDEYHTLEYTSWYENLPDGPVYLGRFLLGYKGKMPENYTLNVKEGTYAIADEAFSSMSNLTNLYLPNSIEHVGADAFSGTDWYSSQPNGAVCAGSALLDFKGIVPSSQSDYVISDGIKCIAKKAFSDISTLTSIEIPSSLRTVGYQAFSKCKNLTAVHINQDSQLKFIGAYAFSNCTALKKFGVSYMLEQIEKFAFNFTDIANLYIPSTVRYIGYAFLQRADVTYVTFDNSSPYYYMDECGVIYYKDKSKIIAVAPAMLPDDYTINENCKSVGEYAFYFASFNRLYLNNVIEDIGESAFYYAGLDYVSKFPDSLKKVGYAAFGFCDLKTFDLGSGIKSIASALFENNELVEFVIPAHITAIANHAFYGSVGHLQKVTFLGNTTIDSNSGLQNATKTTFYCYENSPAHEYAIKYNLTYVLLEKTTDTINLEKIMETANEVNRNLYTQESLAVLDNALSSVDLTVENLTQTQVDAWETSIEAAIANLKYKPADYSSISTAKEAASKIDRSVYTAESLAELDNAVNAVDEGLTVDKQSQVEGYAYAINAAIANLKYKPADYTKVNEQIERANAVDKKLYSQVSVIVLNNIIASVDYSLNISQQATVDGYAAAISQAIDSLEYASVVLRHDVCGVIVSATAKEIYPDTVLAVEKVDSSEHEGTNFAVGGSIRSLHFYDINLILESRIVQPDGTVNVKIRLADGVDPKKCKVYHVTDDLVNPLVRYTSTIDGNYIVFETDHFSEFAVIEVETVLDSIEISSPPSNTLYGIGEKIDLSGLKVTARLSDGTSKEITDYTVGMVSLDSVGAKKVTVYYTMGNITKSAEFEITVTATKTSVDITESGKSIDRVDKKLGLFSLYTKASINLGADIKNADGCGVRWSSDNSKVLVDQNGKVTCKGLFGAKKATITAEILDSNGKVIATDKITVVFYKLSFQLSNLQSIFKNTLLF